MQLLWQGLQAIQQDIPIDDQMDHYPETYQHLFKAQRNIGWDQLYYGRISVQWAQHMTSSSHYTINGDLFYTKVTTLVWQYILDCWQLQNTALHSPQDIPPDAQTLIAQAQQILETVCHAPELAHVALPPQPECLFQRPIHQLRQWVHRGKQHLDQYLTATHKHAVLHTLDIRNFFLPKQANDLQPP